MPFGEYIPGTAVNTDARLVGTAADAFLALGAETVLVAQGPSHQRDTYLVVAQNGLEAELRSQKLRFVDLNRDDVAEVKVRTPFTGLGSLWIPQTVLRADSSCQCPR